MVPPKNGKETKKKRKNGKRNVNIICYVLLAK